MAARSLYTLLCANLSLSDDPTYTRFRPPYVTDQPKYAGVPQRQRPRRITGSADRPAHHPAHLRPTSLRTCAAQLPAPALRIPQALCPHTALRHCAEPPVHLRPTSLCTCAAQLPGPELRIICRPADNSTRAHLSLRLRPLSLRTCPQHMRPTHPAAIPSAPPARSTPAPPPASPARP
ncbi:hypothetical protein C8J57DRAFT_1511159 [Mycena rebaudengoi]|nr:hypothetical protein C8J57DRAFT_1511159 [Mycena rebaudengoi]